jgi:hypothetical protein
MKMDAEDRWDGSDREKPEVLSKKLSPATLPTRSPTKTELVSNPYLLGEKSATICLRLGTALDSIFPHFK